MQLADVAPWVAVGIALLAFLWLDLHLFARGRDPGFREAAIWSVGWLVLSLGAAFVVLAFRDRSDAVTYTTIYLIERSLSLDNLFVFLLLFAYFAIPWPYRPRLLAWGIVGSLVLRGIFILAGTALIDRFQVVTYILGASLIALAWWVSRGVEESIDPDRNLAVRLVRRFYPVTSEAHGGRWLVKIDGRRWATPLLLCLAALIFANVAFAIDSIPAAFAITDDPLLIWTGNVFALLGLRALFVLVESMIARFRFLDETIAVVLALVGVKLITEHWVKIGPVLSLAVVLVAFAIGIVVSLIADRRDPAGKEERYSASSSSTPSSSSGSSS